MIIIIITTVGRPVTARRQGTKSSWHGGVQCLFPHACHCFATRSTATLDLCPNQTCGVDHGPIGLLGPVYHIYIYHLSIYIYIIDTIYIYHMYQRYHIYHKQHRDHVYQRYHRYHMDHIYHIKHT